MAPFLAFSMPKLDGALHEGGATDGGVPVGDQVFDRRLELSPPQTR